MDTDSASLALRRLGSWREDLNVELSNPFTRQIASSWARVFEADLFASFEQATMKVIQQLIDDVAASAAPGLKERAVMHQFGLVPGHGREADAGQWEDIN